MSKIYTESHDLLHAKEAIYRADLPAHGFAQVVRVAMLEVMVKRIVESHRKVGHIISFFVIENLALSTTSSYAITSSLYTGHEVILSTTPSYSDEK